MSSYIISEKKKALLAEKEKLFQEIRYCDTRIEEARTSCKPYKYDDSSDSDTEFTLTIDSGPSIPQLKQKKSMLETCLKATQELTNLEILDSEVNIMVEDPVVEGQTLVTEPGVWRELIADCRIDLVPFSVMFYTHKPDRGFAPNTYHCMQVKPTRQAHEVELSKSVLPALTHPSDAIEVLRSYAAAHRSRRTTLARLAEKFAATIYMEAMPEGGYVIKCANLLTLQWTLQNRWSPIAPFHHRLVFDLEFMDESYIKRITQVHRQLSDPEVETDERTILLAKIINICLEAQGPTQELYDSMSSDPECAQKLDKRRTTLDQEPEAPVMRKKKEDREVMAPPKSLPKKRKSKSEAVTAPTHVKTTSDNDNKNSEKRLKTSEKGSVKDNDAAGNTVENKFGGSKNSARSKKSKIGVAVSRKEAVVSTSESNNDRSEKRLKTSDNDNETKQQSEKRDAKENSVAASKNNDTTTSNTVKKNVANSKISVAKPKVVKPVVKKMADNNLKLKSVNKDIENPSKSTKTSEKDKVIKTSAKSTGKVINGAEKDSVKGAAVSESNSAGREKNTETTKNVTSTDNKSAHANAGKNVGKVRKSVKVTPKKTLSGKIITKDGGKIVKKVVSQSNATQNVVKAMKKFASDNNTTSNKQNLVKANVASKKNNNNPTVSTSKENVTNKNVASAQNSKPNKPPAPINSKILDNKFKSNQKSLKTLHKPTNKALITGNTKIIKAGNTEKENNSATKKIISKIPQKRLPSASQGFMKKVPLRISPRKMVAIPKILSQMSSSTKLEINKNSSTNIPRLVNKPKSTGTS